MTAFLSTPSARRATRSFSSLRSAQRDFYPRPPRGGRRQLRRHHRPIPRISIHALREEGDAFRPPFWLACPNFYPRPPRGGRPVPRPRMLPQQYFYPRPPRGGRRIAGVVPVNAELFLSTPSARRATDNRAGNQCAGTISIHALREEGDLAAPGHFVKLGDFYPRPPRGGRPIEQMIRHAGINFYPRPPRGGRQQKQRQNLYFQTNYTTFCTNLEEP